MLTSVNKVKFGTNIFNIRFILPNLRWESSVLSTGDSHTSGHTHAVTHLSMWPDGEDNPTNCPLTLSTIWLVAIVDFPPRPSKQNIDEHKRWWETAVDRKSKMFIRWRSSQDRMWAGCCISEFVDVPAGVRPVQAADDELELTLFGVFFLICPYPYCVHLHSVEEWMAPAWT